MKQSLFKFSVVSAFALMLVVLTTFNVEADHPNLVITKDSVEQMRGAVTQPGRFAEAYRALKQQVDAQMAQPMVVPVPKDGGGGYLSLIHI